MFTIPVATRRLITTVVSAPCGEAVSLIRYRRLVSSRRDEALSVQRLELGLEEMDTFWTPQITASHLDEINSQDRRERAIEGWGGDVHE